MLNRIESLQDVFNRVWSHYITMYHTFPFNKKENTIVPQDEEGNKDPFRVLIPDHKYRNRFESMFIDEIMSVRGLKKYFSFLMKDNNLALVADLLAAHDRAATVSVNSATHVKGIRARHCYRIFRKEFKDSLWKIATEYNLTVPSSRPYPTYVATRKRGRKRASKK